MSALILAYVAGAMGFLAFKGWGDARAGQGTKVFEAVLASLFWPVIWPLMAGQVFGARKPKDPQP